MNNIFIFVFRSNGIYVAFIMNNFLYSRDGAYLGWVEGNYVWDSSGQFRGVLTELNGNKYILRDKFMLLPVPRVPKATPTSVALPAPVANIAPISLPVHLIDAV